MKLDIVRISIDRKTGERTYIGVVGNVEMSEKVYKEGCVNLLTGKNSEECVREILHGIAGQVVSA